MSRRGRSGGQRRTEHRSCRSLRGPAEPQRRRGSVVAVTGEIDVATSDLLWKEIERAIALSPTLVLDLSETTLVDSTGLSVLVRAHRALGDCGALRVRGAQPVVLKVLDQAGFAQILTIEEVEPGPAERET